MTVDPPFPEAGIDFDRANAARMYDYFLGGGHHFAVDREAAARVLTGYPEIRDVAREMRAFMGRAVHWCCEHGIDQFLDLGSGIPTVGNVHEIAQQHVPTARVAYVDFEPVAVAHSREILADVAGATITAADVRDPATVLDAPGVAGLLDFTRPVAVIAVGLLHFIAGDVEALLGRYRAALAPGSALVITHASDDQDDPVVAERVRGGVAGYRGTATEATLRTRAELRELLDGLDLVAPGLVDITDWPTSDPTSGATGVYGAVATLPS